MAIKKVLVVDDDPTNRKLIVTILNKNNIESIQADNGVEAFNILDKESNIDLILLDIVMPVMNGIEFLKKIKSNPEYMNIPIIVLTTDDSKKREAEQLGAKEFITKPIRPVILLETLNKIN